MQLYQTHKKTNHGTITIWKKRNQKTPFCHAQKQPTIFHKFSVFSTYSVFIATAVFCRKHYKVVFSEEHNFSKTQLVIPTFSLTSKKNTFSKKRCHSRFWTISAETTTFIVFPGFHCFWSKNFWFFGPNR